MAFYRIRFLAHETPYQKSLNHFNFDIYVSKKIDGIFQPGKALSDSINTQRYEADVYVAPDESYLIFSSQRPGSLGRGDLYISWKGEDGKGCWVL